MSIREYKLTDSLTQKQKLWIDEYIKTDDYATASRNAGYTAKNLRSIGYENSIRLRLFIDERRKDINNKINKNTIATVENIQEFWTEILNDDEAKMYDRIKASELLCKSKGGFVEKREVKIVDTDWFI